MPPISAIYFMGLFVGTVLVALLAFRGGVHFGRWRARRPDPEPNLPVRTLIAGVLNLLGFILGFTFALAASHYDARADAIFNEAVAIGTAYHRTYSLPEHERENVKRLLLEYVDARLQVGDPAERTRVLERLNSLQERIREQIILIGNNNGSAGSASSLTQSLAEIIDVHAFRVLMDMRARIQDRMWVSLYCVMIIALAGAGYQCGLTGGRGSIAAVAYAMVFTAVVIMIFIVDNPDMEQFRHTHRPLFELKARLTSTEAIGLWK
jgi:hypothetical protein